LEGLRWQVFRHFTAILVDNGSIDFVRRNYPEVKIIALPENIGNDMLKKQGVLTVLSGSQDKPPA
jgi:hypothetical protein